jgi:hypothetical protein
MILPRRVQGARTRGQDYSPCTQVHRDHDKRRRDYRMSHSVYINQKFPVADKRAEPIPMDPAINQRKAEPQPGNPSLLPDCRVFHFVADRRASPDILVATFRFSHGHFNASFLHLIRWAGAGQVYVATRPTSRTATPTRAASEMRLRELLERSHLLLRPG